MTPKISIVTPSFNQSDFIEQTILSVLTQDYSNLEYIIIDGGSTDNSAEIIKKYDHQLAYWVSEPDGGQTQAINKGLKIASGEIFSWINSDDLLLPGAISAIKKSFQQHPEAGFIYGDYHMIDQSGKTIYKRMVSDYDYGVLVYGRSLITQPASFFRRTVLERIGFLDENYDFCMDLEFWIRAAIHNINFQPLRVPIAANRLHNKTKTFTQPFKLNEQHRHIIRKYSNLWGSKYGFKLANSYHRIRGVVRRMVQRGDWGIFKTYYSRKRLMEENENFIDR
jgi:glycosyltransferase involved in cell wall biosynthesis